MSILNRLSFRLTAPIILVTVLFWAVLYFFVAASIREFAAERAEADLRSIAREVLSTCNVHLDKIMKSGNADDPVELRVAQALTLGDLEDLFLEFQLEAIVSGELSPGKRVPLVAPGVETGALEQAGELNLHQLEVLHAGQAALYAYPFEFKPWRWHIVLLRRTDAYAGLAGDIRTLYWKTGGLLLVMALGLILLGNGLVRSPVNSIIEKLRVGEPPAYRGVTEFEYLSVNIAEMMQALEDREARLRASEARYRTIFETTGTALVIAEQDTTISLVNSEFLEYTGYSREEAQGNMSWMRIIAPEDLNRVKLNHELRQRNPDEAPRQYEFTMVDKRGGLKHVLITADRIPGTTQTLASLIDITDHKRKELELRLQQQAGAAEELRGKNIELSREIETRKAIAESLRVSEERLRAIFENTEDSMFIKNQELEYTHVNPAFLKLLDQDYTSVIGKTDEELSLDSDYATHAAKLEKRVLNGDTVGTEHTLRWKGWPVTLNVVRFPLRGSGGKVFGICAIARDVSDRRNSGDDAIAANAGDYPSLPIQRTVQQVNLAAESDTTVLFLGESGTGKDHWARVLHERSHRSGGSFLSINCAALSPELVESELFGHEAGAFTGACTRKRGLLELAEGGTLLLNEIGEMPLPMQAKLLTFLDTQTIMRLGGQASIPVDVRILAATNRDIASEARHGRFRSDLFFRLDVFTITVPPLRERMEDLPILVWELLSTLGERLGLSEPPTIDTKAIESLMAYHWPGNVRELGNVLERALILSGSDTIGPAHLALKEPRVAGTGGGTPAPLESLFPEDISFQDGIDEAKRLLIGRALELSGGVVKDAAALLGMTRNSINHHIRSLGIRK